MDANNSRAGSWHAGIVKSFSLVSPGQLEGIVISSHLFFLFFKHLWEVLNECNLNAQLL